MAYDDDTDYTGDGEEVEALHRFLIDPVAQKSLLSFVSAYYSALEPDDEEMEAQDHPELSRNDRVLALKQIFEFLDDLLGGIEEDEDEEEDDSEIASLLKERKRRKEVAKDKRMSTFYKAFMGDMRELVSPWFGNRAKFLAGWAAMGNALYSRSPAKPDKKAMQLTVVPVEDENTSEEAAVIGSEAALPTKVSRSLTELGFVPVSQPKSGDAAWVKEGTADGYPDRQVYLIRREEGSYLIVLSQKSKYDTYGKPIRKVTLDEGASDQKILDVVANMYDLLAME